MGLAVAGVAGTLAGNAAGNAMVGNSGNITSSTPGFVNQMNNILSQSLGNAINSSTGYTNQAVAQQNQSLGTATGNLNTGLSNATSAAQNNIGLGLAQSQALQAPYAQTGYNANDAFNQSLGLSTPQGGSAQQAMLLNQAAPSIQAIQQLQQQYPTAPTAPTGPAPTMNTFTDQIPPDQIQAYIKQNQQVQHLAHGVLRDNLSVGGQTFQSNNMGNWGNTQQANMNSLIQQALAQPLFDKANSTYNNQLNTYNDYNKQLSGINFNPQAVQAALQYNNGMFNNTPSTGG